MLVLTGAAGRVLGAGTGVTKELTVFVTFVVSVVTAGVVEVVVEPEV